MAKTNILAYFALRSSAPKYWVWFNLNHKPIK